MRRYLWLIPLLAVIYIYGSEAVGVFQGATEHYKILSGLGFSNNLTTVLVWLSVVIEVAIIAALLLKPSNVTFSLAALWPWVPRFITAFTHGDAGAMGGMSEMNMSLYATAFAMLAYACYERFRPEFLRKPKTALAT